MSQEPAIFSGKLLKLRGIEYVVYNMADRDGLPSLALVLVDVDDKPYDAIRLGASREESCSWMEKILTKLRSENIPVKMTELVHNCPKCMPGGKPTVGPAGQILQPGLVVEIRGQSPDSDEPRYWTCDVCNGTGRV